MENLKFPDGKKFLHRRGQNGRETPDLERLVMSSGLHRLGSRDACYPFRWLSGRKLDMKIWLEGSWAWYLDLETICAWSLKTQGTWEYTGVYSKIRAKKELHCWGMVTGRIASKSSFAKQKKVVFAAKSVEIRAIQSLSDKHCGEMIRICALKSDLLAVYRGTSFLTSLGLFSQPNMKAIPVLRTVWGLNENVGKSLVLLSSEWVLCRS